MKNNNENNNNNNKDNEGNNNKKKTAARIIITFINKTLTHINQNCFIFLSAQDVANVVIDDDNNTHNNLISESEKIDHAKMIFAKTLIAFELMRVNSRFDISRVKVIYKNTHIAKINKNLTRINAIS